MDKRELRRRMYRATARRFEIPVIYVNQAGGNDQLVFDGSSFALNANGDVIASANSFAEDLVCCDVESNSGELHRPVTAASDPEREVEAVYDALVLGTRDYIRKCGFSRALIALSGGIDSSITAVVAVDAIGRENVTGDCACLAPTRPITA